MDGRRVRLTVTFIGADPGSVGFFRWLLAWTVHLHATVPPGVGVRMRVEVLPPEDVES